MLAYDVCVNICHRADMHQSIWLALILFKDLNFLK